MRVLPLGSPLALTVEMQNAEGCTVSAEVQVKAANGGYEGNYLTVENLQARAVLLAGRHYPAWQLSVVCNDHSRRSTPAFGAVLLHRLVKTKQLYTKRIPSGRNERLGGNLFCLFLPPGKGRRLSGCGVLSAAVQLLPFGHSGATAAASTAAFRLPAHAHARALCARAPAGQLPGNCRATAHCRPLPQALLAAFVAVTGRCWGQPCFAPASSAAAASLGDVGTTFAAAGVCTGAFAASSAA